MEKEVSSAIKKICARYDNDRSRLMDIVIDTQREFACVDGRAMEVIAAQVNCQRVDVEAVVSFYAFFSRRPKGKIVIRLCNDVVDRMQGSEPVARAFEQELGIAIGQTTPDGMFSLEQTPCIGMCDQAPSALVNDEVYTYLSTDKVKEIIRELRRHGDPKKIQHRLGDGNNAQPQVHSMVHNGVRKEGQVIFGTHRPEDGLQKALSLTPVEVINELKTSRLRGRGGAGFPTGIKWEFTRKSEGKQKVIICNADEGEPGTFKDRVLLTERADLLFEGMTIGGYAIGAEVGIVYLRAEYAYLREFLEQTLARRRTDHLLGADILGRKGFRFDIRIQMGAGAYVCGEETALISSCEGLRGDPKNRPPFPAQKGYQGHPTTVNNVETLCCVARIMAQGAPWFAEIGSKGSPSTKLLSVSGDCSSPGVYEFPFGVKVSELLHEVGAANAQAVLIGGPSGQFISPQQCSRTICYDDLATGGAVVVFGPERNLLEIVKEYMDFFIEEGCGYCTPCRVGNVLLKKRLEKIISGKGEPSDLQYLEELGKTVKLTSRCGLGQTSANPILSTLTFFRNLYEQRIGAQEQPFQPEFDIRLALTDAEDAAGRKSVVFET